MKKTTLIVRDLDELKSKIKTYEGEVESIRVEGPPANLKDVIEVLKELKLYVIVAKPNTNLEKLGIKGLDYYAIDPITVTDINLLPEEDHFLFNGNIKIPKTVSEKSDVVGTYFLDEDWTRDMCRELNVHQSNRFEEIQTVIMKSKEFIDDIAANALT